MLLDIFPVLYCIKKESTEHLCLTFWEPLEGFIPLCVETLIVGHSARQRPHVVNKRSASDFNRLRDSHSHQVILSLHQAGGRQHRSLHGRALEHSFDFAADAADPEGLAPLRRVPAGKERDDDGDARRNRRGF